MKIKTLILFALYALFFAPSVIHANEAQCLKWIYPFKQAHEKANEEGGIWAQFEKRVDLRNDSTLALKLDSKIKELFGALSYLCKTQEGVPYDELANFVAKELAQISIPDFKKKWIQLGKPPERVDSWIEYHSFTKKNLHRKLEIEKIKTSIQESSLFFDRYQKLFEKLSSQTQTSTLEVTRELLNEISQLFQTEPYLLQATHENSRVLYWDIDENYGGS